MNVKLDDKGGVMTHRNGDSDQEIDEMRNLIHRHLMAMEHVLLRAMSRHFWGRESSRIADRLGEEFAMRETLRDLDQQWKNASPNNADSD